MLVKMGNVVKRVLIISIVVLYVCLRFVYFIIDFYKMIMGNDYLVVGILEEKKKYGKEIMNLYL